MQNSLEHGEIYKHRERDAQRHRHTDALRRCTDRQTDIQRNTHAQQQTQTQQWTPTNRHTSRPSGPHPLAADSLLCACHRQHQSASTVDRSSVLVADSGSRSCHRRCCRRVSPLLPPPPPSPPPPLAAAASHRAVTCGCMSMSCRWTGHMSSLPTVTLEDVAAASSSSRRRQPSPSCVLVTDSKRPAESLRRQEITSSHCHHLHHAAQYVFRERHNFSRDTTVYYIETRRIRRD